MRISAFDRIAHEIVDPPPVGLHDLEVKGLCTARDVGTSHALFDLRVVDGGVVVRPPVVHLVHVHRDAQHHGLEVVHARPLPPCTEPARKVGLGGPVAALTDGGRRTLEHVDVLCGFGERRHALNPGRSSAQHGDDLVAETIERLVGAATGVVVVPARRVERDASEILHPCDDGQLHEVEDPDGQDVPPATHHVAAVGVDPPARRILVPLSPGDARLEQRVAGQIESLGDCLEVCSDLFAVRVAPGRDVAELLEHRHVDVGLDVAHHARVPVPVPRTPDPSGLVDDADPLDTGLAEIGAGEGPGDPTADDDHVDLVSDRSPLDVRRERVVPVLGEMRIAVQVAYVRPAFDQPLVPLGEILGVDRLRVEAGGLVGWRHGAVGVGSLGSGPGRVSVVWLESKTPFAWDFEPSTPGSECKRQGQG